jgi:hypothetical protein
MINKFESYDDALNYYKREYPNVNHYLLELALSLDYQEQMEEHRKLCKTLKLINNDHSGASYKEKLKEKLEKRQQQKSNIVKFE